MRTPIPLQKRSILSFLLAVWVTVWSPLLLLQDGSEWDDVLEECGDVWWDWKYLN